MSHRIEIDPGWGWTQRYGITPAVQVGNRIQTTGLIAVTPDGKLIGEGDMAAQARRVFASMHDLLAEVGASMADVVKITAYLTDIGRYGEYAAARGEAFPHHPPASTTIATPALVLPELLVEVEAIAELGSGTT